MDFRFGIVMRYLIYCFVVPLCFVSCVDVFGGQNVQAINTSAEVVSECVDDVPDGFDFNSVETTCSRDVPDCPAICCECDDNSTIYMVKACSGGRCIQPRCSDRKTEACGLIREQEPVATPEPEPAPPNDG